MALRRAAVAGTWYSSNPSRLTRDVSTYLDNAETTGLTSHKELVALIAPHAGLMYSGPVAAFAYRLLQGRVFDTIALVGPSHYVAFEGASIWSSGAFETPFGLMQIDSDLADAIRRCCPIVGELPEAHAREHSLEMQLPFVGVCAPNTTIVPIVMGEQTRATATSLAEGLASALQGRRALLVASSDLSHFHDAATAAAMDRRVIDHVDRLDPDGLMQLLESRPEHACGGGPMVSVLHAARALGGHEARVLRYGDSGDVSGDKSSVVGYMAAAVWR
jgi:AmmeMemoRadiSam system protein B